MKIYLIGGLGADERVFNYLKLNYATKSIKWIKPKPGEKLNCYAKRLSKQINPDEEFGILGVSFGGIVAIEISKHIKPAILILISSVETRKQLPQKYVLLGKTKILNMIPNWLIKPPQPILNFLFGAKNKELLKEIIRDTDSQFIRWALNAIINWSNETEFNEVIRIHGTKDKLIPLKGPAIKIINGGHFMIIDRAEEISTLINEQVKSAENNDLENIKINHP